MRCQPLVLPSQIDRLCRKPEPGRMRKHPARNHHIAIWTVIQSLESDNPESTSRSQYPTTRDTHNSIPSPSFDYDSDQAADVGSWNSWVRTLASRDPRYYFAEACPDSQRDEEGKRWFEGQHPGGTLSKFVFLPSLLRVSTSGFTL